jgi:hypothetical protein
MDLQQLIEIASFIDNSESIPKQGLKVVYNLPLGEHKILDRELHEKTNNTSEYIHRDIINVNLGGILFTIQLEKEETK